MIEKERADYTEGSITQSIVKMGMPSMIGFLAQHFYYLVDMFWLSMMSNGQTAVAAVTIFSNISWVFFSFNSLVGAGSVAIISRRYGEKNFDSTETAIKETFLLKFSIGVILGLAGFFLTDKLMYIGGARGETLDLGIQYGRVIFLGMGFSYASYSVYTAMRGIANPNLAMGIMIASNVLNLILDPLLIMGYLGFPKMGIIGAAVATVISYVVAFSSGLICLFSGITNVQLHLRSRVKMSLRSMRQIIGIGVPSWIGEMSLSVSRFVVMPMIAIFGDSVVAAYGVGMQISNIGNAIMVGIGLGLASLIGHNLGGGKKERALRTANQAILISLGITISLGIIVFFLSKPIMSLYFSSPETVANGVALLRILVVAFPFMGAYIMLHEIYAGVGLNTPGMILNVGNAWILEIPAIFILTRIFHFDQIAVWWVVAGASAISMLLFYWYYRRGQWLHVKV